MKLKINGNEAVFGKKTVTVGKKGALVLSVLIDNCPCVVRYSELMEATGIHSIENIRKQISMIKANLKPLTKVSINTHILTGYGLVIKKGK